MKTAPFFRADEARPDAAAAKPPRYPYHDDAECPIGKAVLRGGQWQYYEPRQVADTRLRCPLCVELDSSGQVKTALAQ